MQACDAGEPDEVRKLIAQGAPVNEVSTFNYQGALVNEGAALFHVCGAERWDPFDEADPDELAEIAEDGRKRAECVRLLLEAGAGVTCAHPEYGASHQANILFKCIYSGRHECLALLLNALPSAQRAAWLGLAVSPYPEQFPEPTTLLLRACERGEYGCAQCLLQAKADPNLGTGNGSYSTLPAMWIVALGDLERPDRVQPQGEVTQLALLQQLSLHGASREERELRYLHLQDGHGTISNGGPGTLLGDAPVTPERILEIRISMMDDHPLPGANGADPARRERAQAAHHWLQASHGWCTPLHHLELLPAERARALLRAGAHVHASVDGGPSPLSIAQAREADGRVDTGSAAALVLSAGRPWSPANHHLFPAPSRARAVELLLMGALWSRSTPSFHGVEQALYDLWRTRVMPIAVHRHMEEEAEEAEEA
jgi:hypothetical protein